MPKLPITLVDYGQPEAYKEAKTEFIVFVKDGERYFPTVDKALLQVYKDKPQFRKLSMIAPAIVTQLSTIYGWTVTSDVVSPKYTKSSLEPYAIQFGSVTGSLIRKSALERVDYQFTGNRLADSVGLSLAFWEAGQMCVIAPDVERHGVNALDMSTTAIISPDTLKLFKREMIG